MVMCLCKQMPPTALNLVDTPPQPLIASPLNLRRLGRDFGSKWSWLQPSRYLIRTCTFQDASFGSGASDLNVALHRVRTCAVL